MFDKKYMHKLRTAKFRIEQRAKRIQAVINRVRRSIWLHRFIKWGGWCIRLCLKIAQKLTWPLWAPFALLRYLIAVTWAFIRGRKSRSTYVLNRKRKEKRDDQNQQRQQSKPSWRRWFGLLFVIFLLKGILWKVIAFTISPWTLLIFFLRRLWSAKNYVDECRQDKRDAAVQRRYMDEEEERETTRLLRKQEEENKFERTRAARRAEVLQALKDF